MKAFIKILGIGILMILGLFIIAFLFLKYRLGECRKASDTMVEEFASGKSSERLFTRAHELGFGVFYIFDSDSKNEDRISNQAASDPTKLAEFQKRLAGIKNAHVEMTIVPFPPFLRWILKFQIENNVVKSVDRTQLD